MNRVEELIQQLCPNGVEWKKLGEVCEILDSQRRPVEKTKRSIGKYPYYGANGIQDYVDDFLFNGTFLLVGEDGSVINKDNSPILNWATGKIWVNNHAHILSERKEIMSLRFLYFVLSVKDISKLVRGVPPKLNQVNLRNIEIPIPPLPIQQEIVRILDTFTELTANLQTELDARKKQYAYYRDCLLNFEGVDGVEWKKLGEIGLFYGGLSGKTKKDFEEGNAKYVTYSNIFNNIAVNLNINDVVNILPGEKQNVIAYGDVIFTGSSETPDECGMSSVVTEIINEPIYLNSFCFGFRLNNLSLYEPGFLKFLFRSNNIRNEIKKTANGVTRYNISKKLFSQIEIPIPPLPEQRRIVAILDHFETLVNDLSVGLPAELEARRKQYEYYRDKLLTFDRV